MAATYVYVILLTLIGPENKGRNFEVEHDEDMEEATHRHFARDTGSGSDDVVDEKVARSEKESV